MEIAVFVVICAVVAAMGYARRDRTIHGTEASLCLTCLNAVITRGTRGEETIACNYGGAMRPVKFTVCQCTGFACAVSSSTATSWAFAARSCL